MTTSRTSQPTRTPGTPGTSGISGSEGRIRIGYVSRDFYDHPVAHQTQGIFKLLMAKGEAAGRRAWMEEKGHLVEADL